MATLANIQVLPGLYGGGFARVVQVERLSSGRGSGSGQEAVRLEKLSNPLEGFKLSLAQFTNGGQSVPQTTARLSGDAVTLLQQVSDPMVQQPDQSYAQQLSEAEARRKELANQQREEEEQHEAAMAALRRQLEKAAAGFEVPSLPGLNLDQIDGEQLALNTSTAAQAAAAYAATLGSDSTAEKALSA